MVFPWHASQRQSYNQIYFCFHKESSETETDKSAAKKQPKEKPLYLRDYERKIIVEKGGQYSEDENSEDGGDSDDERNKRETSPTYVEEQRQIQER